MSAAANKEQVFLVIAPFFCDMEDAAEGITAQPPNPTSTLYQIFLSIGKREPYLEEMEFYNSYFSACGTHAGTAQRTTSESPAYVPARVPRA